MTNVPRRTAFNWILGAMFVVVSGRCCLRREWMVTAFTTGVSRTTTRTFSKGNYRVREAKTAKLRSTATSSNGDNFVDESGRRLRIRTEPAKNSAPASSSRTKKKGWDDNDDDDDDQGDDFNSDSRRQSNPSSRKPSTKRSSSSWDDFDPWQDQRAGKNDNGIDDSDGWGSSPATNTNRRPQRKQPQSLSSSRPQRKGMNHRGGDYFRDFNDRRNDRGANNSQYDNRNGRRSKFDRDHQNKDSDKASSRSINMNALEGAGFVHLYGISSVLNALAANRRDFVTSIEKTEAISASEDGRFQGGFSDPDFYDDDEEDLDEVGAPQSPTGQVDVKPQAQFRPYLFVQDQRDSGRRGAKASAAQQLIELAEQRGVPIAHVDKGILNTLCGNRPHQGFVLRCGKLSFESLSRIPMPTSEHPSPSLWLVLDEVVDPQNLGALIRSAYFLGGGGGSRTSNPPKVGVLVCSKNSAPPSPVVSASSAGSLELLQVYSTTNLPRTLNQAREDGFRIIGASSSVPSSSGDGNDEIALYDLQDLPAVSSSAGGDDRPVLLVLGSEGHGLRTLVAKACTELVRIPSGSVVEQGDNEDDAASEAGVDSLNVSVTGGIMLWHLLK